jgi:hypothetical protein
MGAEEVSLLRNKYPCELGRPRLFPFLVPFAAVTKCKAHADAHESERRYQEDKNPSADCALTILGGARGVRVTHRARLGESRHRPKRKSPYEDQQTTFHFTPKWTIRHASGKKKIHIKAKHAQTDIMRSQRIVRISDFKCMK